MLNRLDFTLDFEQDTIYLSEDIRDIWEYRIHRISQMESNLELLAVKAGIRPAARKIIKYLNLYRKYLEYKNMGLKYTPISNSILTDGYSLALAKGQESNALMVVVTKEDYNVENTEILSENNNAMGEILGYPQCCTTFFYKNWVEEKFKDSVYQSAYNTKSADINGNTITVENSPDTNSILKCLGVRATFHMPHSFDCKESEKIAEQLRNLAIENGYEKEIKWRDQLLSSEIKWSSLHGVAIITTPVSKTRMPTDALATKYEVIHKGHRNFKKHTKKLWTQNGFISYATMETAHDLIEEEVKFTDAKSIFDYGCGNGFLLSKLNVEEKAGLELNGKAIEYGNRMFNNLNLIQGDMNYYTLDKNYDVILISSPRLVEAERAGRLEFLLEQLEKAKRVLLYEYSDGIGEGRDSREYFKSLGLKTMLLNNDGRTKMLELYL